MNRKQREKRKIKHWLSYGNGFINGLELLKIYLTDEVGKTKNLSELEINNAIDRTHRGLKRQLKTKIDYDVNFIKD